MNKNQYLSALRCFLLTAVCILAGSNGAEAKGRVSEKKDQAIISYFQEQIGKDSLQAFHSKGRLKYQNIGEATARIWKLWKEANTSYPEDKLIPLRPLSEDKKGLWPLPKDKEPNAEMPYFWGSKGERPEAGYPLFLYLHGSGPKEAEWSTGLKLAKVFDDAPSVYFIPQIPNEGGYYRWWQKAKLFAWERLFRQAFLSDSINPNRIYCFGISEGGYGSQRLASYYADYLAAAGPMAGGEPLKNAPAENCMNIGFSFLTGAEDYGFYRNTLTTYTHEAFDSLQKLSPDYYKHRIELIPGRGHGIDYSPTTPWLKTFVRNAQPKQFVWENLDMDGIYRKGFYNLYIEEPSTESAEERTCYSVNIENNQIDLKVENVTYHTTETDPKWGIALKFRKEYKPATKGRIRIFLSDRLVDLTQKVKVTVNGKEVTYSKPSISMDNLVLSCALFSDPERLFPASIVVNLDEIQE